MSYSTVTWSERPDSGGGRRSMSGPGAVPALVYDRPCRRARRNPLVLPRQVAPRPPTPLHGVRGVTGNEDRRSRMARRWPVQAGPRGCPGPVSLWLMTCPRPPMPSAVRPGPSPPGSRLGGPGRPHHLSGVRAHVAQIPPTVHRLLGPAPGPVRSAVSWLTVAGPARKSCAGTRGSEVGRIPAS